METASSSIALTVPSMEIARVTIEAALTSMETASSSIALTIPSMDMA
jgi:hypothetical protein